MRTIGKPIPDHIAERAATQYRVDENGCHVALGATNQSRGYRTFATVIDGKSSAFLAHRASWTFHNGPIPKGLTVDHMCFNRQCVNPDHLRLLSLTENSRRRWGADFPLGQCKFGHPNSSLEVFHYPKGDRRVCRDCIKAHNDYSALLNKMTRRLEIALGLGDWFKKPTHYIKTVNELRARSAEIRATWPVVGSTPEGQKDADLR